MNVDEIICGDNVAILENFPDNCIDLTVTSPPYDQLRDYNGYSWDFEALARQLFRVTKDGGVVVWVVGDATIKGSESGSSFRQALYFKEIGFNLHDTMIYEKNGSPFPDKTRYYNIFEYMFVFSKGKPKTINLIQDRKNKWLNSWGSQSSREKNGELKQYKREDSKEFGVRFNIWRINTGSGFTTKDKFTESHPAPFPESLAHDHIISWSNTGDLVLDPFSGSGTTAKMAKETGRHWIGIDISDEYCKMSEKRVNSTITQMF